MKKRVRLLFMATSSLVALLEVASSQGTSSGGGGTPPAATTTSTLFQHCASLSFNDAATPECFMSNAEILPNLRLSGTPVFHSVASAIECQSRCSQVEDCAYFTYRVDTVTEEKVCILKPAPSLETSPILTLRVFDSSDGSASKFNYTSGPKTCGQKCYEEVELVAGCGGSAPGSCAQLPHSAVFNAACLDPEGGDDDEDDDDDDPTASDCNVQGYRCCERKVAGCEARLSSGYQLTGGTTLQSYPVGVKSKDHCWALCISTTGCTHWNFITSTTTSFVGGGCYLRAFESVTEPGLIRAASHQTSIIGGVTCDGDYGLVAPAAAGDEGSSTTTTTPAPGGGGDGGLGGVTVPGSACFESELDILHGGLWTKWGVFEARQCQELCQEWPGCVAFAWGENEAVCHLKYTLTGLTNVPADAENNYVVGPRDCPGVTPAPTVPGCITSDEDIEGDNERTEAATGAAHCGLMCTWQNCAGWTYHQSTCYIKKSGTPRVKKPGVAAGTSGCNWPGYGRRRAVRALSAAEMVLLSNEEVQGCALHNKDVKNRELEIIGGTESVEDCHGECLRRKDCFFAVYTPADKLCRVKYAGALIDRFGAIVIPRHCGCEENSETSETCSPGFTSAISAIKQQKLDGAPFLPVHGLSQRALGRPSTDWIVKGSLPDFSNPSTWARVALLVMDDSSDDGRDCFVSDLLRSVETCWDRRHDVLPLSVHVQIIGVAKNAHFRNWDGVSWEPLGTDVSTTQGYFELFNEKITIQSDDDPASGGHGVYLRDIIGEPAPSWPANLQSPIDFRQGEFFARVQATGLNTIHPARLLFCITGSDDPLAEMCSAPIVVPPTAAHVVQPTQPAPEHHVTPEATEEAPAPQQKQAPVVEWDVEEVAVESDHLAVHDAAHAAAGHEAAHEAAHAAATQ